MPDDPKRVTRPLWRRLALLAAIIAVVPLAGLGALLLDVNTQALTRGTWATQIVLAGDLARTLDGELASAGRTLDTLASILVDDSLDDEARLQRALTVVEVGGVDHVGIYDVSGARVDVIRRGDVEPDLPARLDDEAYVDGALLLRRELRAGGHRTGTLASAVRVDGLAARARELAEAHLPGGAIHIVGRIAEEGTAIVASSSGATSVDLEGIDVATLAAPRSEEREDVVRTVAPLGSNPLVVVIESPVRVVYASLRSTRLAIGIGLALAILLAVVMSVFFARRTVRPIAALSRFARALAERQFDRRIEVTGDDELGALARDLDRTARALQSSEAQIRAEEAIRLDLGRYLPAELVEKVVRREQAMELGGQRTNITVLFADVVAFTPLAEELPPEEVVALLNELFTLLTGVVFRHGGTVDKFLGDSVMALFGAPAADPEHARHALRAAEDMLAFVETASEGWAARLGVHVQLAIGVASGDAVVGNVGSVSRMEYTAIGDVVNVAARLEAIARPGQILTTEATQDAAGAGFEFVLVDERTLAGRSTPLRILEVRP